MIFGTQLSLDEWIQEVLYSPNANVNSSNCFPRDDHREEFLESVHSRTDKQTKQILKLFLNKTKHYGCDSSNRKFLVHMIRNDPHYLDHLLLSESLLRLISPEPWPGITWVLDLLPEHPQQAIQSITSYITVHASYMSDQMIDGHFDAIAIIRAKWMHAPVDKEFFLALESRSFEKLVSKLFEKIGFETMLGTGSGDGGIDVLAISNTPGNQTHVGIQCKCWRTRVRRPTLDQLRGVVGRNNLSRGIIICPGGFTKGTIAASREEPGRIELIDGEQLKGLCDQHFASSWHLQIERIISESRAAEYSE